MTIQSSQGHCHATRGLTSEVVVQHVNPLLTEAQVVPLCSPAAWCIHDPLMLGPQGDQGMDGRQLMSTPLHYCLQASTNIFVKTYSCSVHISEDAKRLHVHACPSYR
jgi:hypothetical protein